MNNTSYWQSYVAENESKLIGDQRVAYDAILDSVDGNKGKIFFIDALGGTGKTFLINLLLAKVRSKGQEAIAVAFTRIAAARLHGGRTAHSTFNLPFNVNPQKHKEAIDFICKNAAQAKPFQEAVIVFWDECNITHRVHLETVNKILQNLRLSSKIMGGLTFVLSGDFRRALPIIPGGSRKDFVGACLQRSTIWPHVQKLSLHTKISSDPRAADFGSLLLDVGNGSVQSDKENNIELNEGLGVQVETLDDLINNVYPDIENLPSKNSQWLSERAIISPINLAANEINTKLQDRYQSEIKTFYSIDKVVNPGDIALYSQKYLNTLNSYGLPPHQLIIKIGAPVMLLRNLEPPRLCNGTRLQVTGFSKDVILTKILTGPGTGEPAKIRICSMEASGMQASAGFSYADVGGNTYRSAPIGVSPSIGGSLSPPVPADKPVRFKRKQYPVKLCFAITINRAHGQSFKCVGVDLRCGCFSHGQLYVALSRVGRRDAQFILLPNCNRTPNIVYKEVVLPDE